MARIRSIKPDFFTSEKIATLPLSARLLFIGLWTHVDDNGVAPDNEKLINAAIWPLEDDPRESLQRTREDLRRLSTAGLIVRYEASGKPLLFIRSWDEHQKVSHPAKPRYPRPSEQQIEAALNAATSRNDPEPEPPHPPSGNPPEGLQSPPEILAPEQGAGSREQGAGIPPSAGTAPPRRAPAPPGAADEHPAAAVTAQTLVAEYIDTCRHRPPSDVLGQLGKRVKQLLDDGIPPDAVRDGMTAWAAKGLSPSTLPAVVNEVMNRTTPAQPGKSRNAQILDAAMERALAAEAAMAARTDPVRGELAS
ncbi:hypothetical protein ACFYY8_33700 [Streptosporangium sp. NPDC001559]|uniref:hypothetical protein n=1 Tax=Streptosporangium sp. NPDC001559 TaxID=3366187 RepID=UPI0036E1F562